MEEWRKRLCINDIVDARDMDGNWYESIITNIENDMLSIHYKGWNNRYDTQEHRFSCNIYPLYTYVQKWREYLQEGDIIEYRSPNERWYVSYIVEINNTNKDMLCIQYGNNINNEKVWLSRFSEEICVLKTHIKVSQLVYIITDYIQIIDKKQRLKWKVLKEHINTIDDKIIELKINEEGKEEEEKDGLYEEKNDHVTNNNNNFLLNKCCICLTDPYNIVFLPCKHLCVCISCNTAKITRRCPICRETIHDIIQVYTS
jgi:hypothetical protein